MRKAPREARCPIHPIWTQMVSDGPARSNTEIDPLILLRASIPSPDPDIGGELAQLDVSEYDFIIIDRPKCAYIGTNISY